MKLFFIFLLKQQEKEKIVKRTKAKKSLYGYWPGINSIIHTYFYGFLILFCIFSIFYPIFFCFVLLVWHPIYPTDLLTQKSVLRLSESNKIAKYRKKENKLWIIFFFSLSVVVCSPMYLFQSWPIIVNLSIK